MTFTLFDPTVLADPSDADYNLHYLKSFFDDKAAGQGPHPSGANFADEELQNFLLVAGNDVNGAYIQGCRALATSWSSFAVSEKSKVGSYDAKEVAQQWKERAEEASKNPIDAKGKPFVFGVV